MMAIAWAQSIRIFDGSPLVVQAINLSESHK
jgi:hypothetical protein